MFNRLGNFVSRHWLSVIVCWIALVVFLECVSPDWWDVARDGDLAYLPDEMPSVVGDRLLAEAFPQDLAKSQIALFVARDDDNLANDDYSVSYELAARFKNMHAVVAMAEVDRLEQALADLPDSAKGEDAAAIQKKIDATLQVAEDSLDEAIDLDSRVASYWVKREASPNSVRTAATRPPRLAVAYFNRALLYDRKGQSSNAVADRAMLESLDPTLLDKPAVPLPEEDATMPVLDVWTWRDEMVGEKLSTKQARLVVLQLSNEFMATDNIRVLDYLDTIVADIRSRIVPDQRQVLHVGYSGSAAVGGDMLRAAQDSIANTELFTVVLVVIILGFVYRSPLLIIMPLATITVSLLVATNVVALLTQVNQLPGFSWWDYKIFTTTRIFIVVILFGGGTDYFLFLVSRYREELEQGHANPVAVSRALGAVGDALVASALTTILGLGTMFFADFGKFSNSGPTIGLCLFVTLAACMTLAPALLRACGRAVFWPFGIPTGHVEEESATVPAGAVRSPWINSLWERLADAIVAYPGMILVVAVVILYPLAQNGFRNGNHVTYDLLSDLPKDRPSRYGADVMERHFPIGEGAPIILLAYRQGGSFDTKTGREEKIDPLMEKLYQDGVASIRSITDPLGEFLPPFDETRRGRGSFRRMVATAYPRTQEIYVSTTGPYAGDVTRLDLVLEYDPFSVEAREVLENVEKKVHAMSADPNSFWHNATFAYSGTTAGIRDLELVTQGDNRRIQLLTVLAVLGVLLVILQRPLVCIYMIASVLFSYYVTIGATEWFFAWAYGSEFQGLDWKVPLFLFVILVAIGQDYNVYLATRVFEEQQRLGLIGGLRYAVVRTGGIITSCGVIMAGTFISMTSGTWGDVIPAWVPFSQALFATDGGPLPGIVQLGFALSLGVILDTFVVRPILLPAFLALLCRIQLLLYGEQRAEDRAGISRDNAA